MSSNVHSALCVGVPSPVLLQWFYENKPLQYSKMVNGPSYKRWKLPLPVMSTLYRLAGQVLPCSPKLPPWSCTCCWDLQHSSS